jgi:hypothetical protein
VAIDHQLADRIMRKTLTYVVRDEGRDQGKSFLLTEMPADQAESWAIRAFLAMAKGGIELPEGIESSGFAGIAKLGLTLLLQMPFELAKPLLDEMMACVQILPNPNNPSVVRALIGDDIEEVATRIKLRKEVFGLHVNFSLPGVKSTLESAPANEKPVSSNIQIRRKR